MGFKTRVLIISSDAVGPAMAGTGIRYAALAGELGREFEVLLVAPQGSQPLDGPFELAFYARDDEEAMRRWASAADVLLFPGDVLLDFPWLSDLGKPIVMDGYDPHTAETLYWTREQSMATRLGTHAHRQRLLAQQCLVGDFFICAGEVQRTWWLGLLEMTGRINPYTFDEDPTLRKLVDCVPYGLPDTPLPPVPPDFRPFGLTPEDPVLLWGGGLWDWLDPLTAIRAVPQVLRQVPSARLLFPGTRHPNPSISKVEMVEQARDLAQALGLMGTHVFFGDWVPRAEWPFYLQRAAVGLSLHPESYETHLAFRSRLLEYIWAGLPMVVTGGDETAQVVQRYGLGRVVPVQDVDAVAQALVELLQTPREAWAPAFAQAREALTWARAVEPLRAFCRAPRIAPDKAAGLGRGNPLFIRDLETLRAELEVARRERDEAQALVQAYERGRFMRFMRWLKERVK